ncbi:two component transcriptional regulator, LuxR family [Bifidobacterium bohemicum]|uniref:Two component transcriptional regulator, LuxR family n=1 Tax=Bifidobacterium bohemicum DSM 22767 TaxID=1437606 RepID=A0A086ZJP2_9BIFI|nr:response regulator transcription factor [Bifidobacterium bohemicum]KFI46742.1 two component transcriptional regulator, LuxR family [Bifidobacterium bohemicum DSM 22767]SCB80320.1 two component transcriptional regulator, LuxR family [Bifidobacterium bohemicum]
MKTAIVDDDPIVCSSLTTILETTEAAEVRWTANDGETAVTNYFSNPASRPDVLLIDIQMPGVDGLQAAQRILARDKTARILFLTTFADKAYIDQALALEAKGYLIKQDVTAVGPALQAVMAGHIVLGAEVLDRLSTAHTPTAPTTASSWFSSYSTPPSPTASPDRNAGIGTNTDSQSASTNERTSVFAALSDRERDIASLVSKGLDNHTIAAYLYLSEGTVRNRITGILDKLGLSNRTQLAITWINAGLP